MKITVLVENVSKNPCIGAEHGLSLYIETAEKKILFDMGQGTLFLENAKVLGVDLRNIDFAIVSHGHYDHGGGLGCFFELNDKAPVYINRYAFGAQYNGNEKYIGLDLKLKDNPGLIYTEDMTKITDNIFLYSCNNNKREYPSLESGLKIRGTDGFINDEFLHEQYLLVQENGKKYLFSGCSHKGILNITNWFKPDVLVGGFHFSKITDIDILKDYSKNLNSFNTTYYTCHCTGIEQYEIMKKHMNNLNYISVGDVIVL